MRSHVTLLGAGLILLASACATDTTGIRITGNDAQAAFERWEATAPPETRETIQQLKKDPTLLIHIREGKVDGDSRGTSSTFGSPTKLKKNGCPNHPPSDSLDPQRNWDLVYDKKQQNEMEKSRGLPSPTHVLLHHEIIGHIVPVLDDPTIIETKQKGDKRAQDEIEDRAIRQENKYRRLLGLPFMPLSSDQPHGH